MKTLELARPHLRCVQAYKSARSLASGGEVLLDANESPRVLSEDAALKGMNRYPSPQPPALVREAARYYGVPAGRLVVTRGSDEGIDLLVRAFVEPKTEDILITPPTYGVYAIAANLHGSPVREAPLDASNGFAFDAAKVLSVAKASAVKLVFICRPNNPTGTGVPLSAVEAVAAGLKDRALVVVDEAYLEFTKDQSATGLIDRFPNIVVLKTLSKAWGLAGARIGFLIGAPALAGFLHAVRAPYPISAAAAAAAESIFHAAGETRMRASVTAILIERERLAKALAALTVVAEVLPSEANFVIARFKDKNAALTALRSRGIIVRDRSAEPGLAGAIRITVGLPAENARLLEVLEKL